MIKVIRNILITLAATLAAIGCIKTSVPDKSQEGSPILLTAVEAGSPTKALLDKGTFSASGNSLKIYDHYTAGQSGSPATGYYIRDNATSDGNGTWPFSERHQWTTDGVHKFWGWLDKDVNFDPDMTAADFFGSGFQFDEGSQTLTIPEKEMAPNSSQFDFMYSNIYTRDLNPTPDLNTTPDFSPIPLEFNHLFTAFRITATNNSSNDVWLKKVSITGLKNKREASIDFSGDEPNVSFIASGNTQNFVYDISDEGMFMTKGQTYNVSQEDFQLMWPHTKDDFADSQIVVDYKYKEPSAATPLDGQTTIDLKDVISWKGGQKNNVGLMFKDKEISLTCKVEPWTVVADTIDFNDQITVSNPLTWVPNTVESVNYENGEVVLYTDSYSVAVCNFRIDTPAGATWTASLIPVEGYSDAFKILDNTKYGAVGVDSEVHIQVTNMAPIAPRHIVLLRITVQTADGRTIVADMMPDQTDESVTEFKLIQNLING